LSLKKIIPALAILAVIVACQPERVYLDDPGARLGFSLDTVFFDTVFTTVGTVTKSFRIRNPHNQFLKVRRISLAGGPNSVFRINVDGQPGYNFRDMEIAPRDSMYIFVEATLDPNNSDQILRIQDSIVFETNGNIQDIDLVAWGQDVHMIRQELISGSVTWTAQKPYLILDIAYVDSTSELILDPGTTVYLHRDAVLFVEGSLRIQGTLDEPVRFRGDRLEEFYQDVPGQWGLIYLSERSRENRVDHAEIVGGTLGILISAPPESGQQPDLEITNSTINHMSSHGIYALNARVRAGNLVIGDCGGSCAALVYGGNYSFVHTTLFNSWPSFYSNRQLPALFLADYFVNYNDQGDLEVISGGSFEQAEFLNSIISGDARSELLIDSYTGRPLKYRFDHCLIKINDDSLDLSPKSDFDGHCATQ
jgi:hypothetical protein